MLVACLAQYDAANWIDNASLGTPATRETSMFLDWLHHHMDLFPGGPAAMATKSFTATSHASSDFGTETSWTQKARSMAYWVPCPMISLKP